MKGSLVTLSGIDCSGKTTQLELLEGALTARGLSFARFWYRPGYSPELNALRDLIRRHTPGVLPSAGPSEERDKVMSQPGVSGAWITMALVDMIVQYALKLRALLASYDFVVCDRYIEDAALDFALHFPEAGVQDSALFGLVRMLAPQPRASFLLMISHDEMLRRMKFKNEPIPDPPEVRDARFECYERLATTARVQPIDASQSIEQVHQDIISALGLDGAASRG